MADTGGFWSYARRDEQPRRDGRGDALDSVRAALVVEIGRRLGRDFPLWIDRADIASGERWRNEIQQGLSKARIFVPILTPSWLNSPHCRDEFEAFNRYDRSRRGAAPGAAGRGDVSGVVNP